MRDDADTTEAPEVEAPEAAPIEAPAPVEDSGPAASLRETLSKALDGDATADKPARPRDEAGRFTEAERAAQKAAAAKAKPPEVRKAGAPPPAALKATQAPVVPSEAPALPKPPASWKPAAREKWGALPEEARAEVLRRESEVSKALNETAEARKYADSMRQAVEPYRAQILAEGSTPERAVANLLQTAQALRTAPPAHKAQLVASMIRDFGVPLDGLVAALSGEQPPSGAGQRAPSSFDPAEMAGQVKAQLLAELTQQREAAMVARATTDVDSFLAEKEFGEDLRPDMADVIEAAARRGVTMSLEDAYNRAARLHPDVSKVFEQRQAAERAAKAQASTQRSRLAASSVKSNPGTTPVPSGGKSDLRSVLEAAFDR